MTIPANSVGAIDFRAPEHSEQGLALPGSTQLHQACTALGWDATEKKLVHSVLIWGWPGTGKTIFPLSLHRALAHDQGLRFSLLSVNCAALSCLTDDDALGTLARVQTVARETRPLLLAVSQAEHLASGIPQNSFVSWLTDYLSNSITGGPVIALVITAHPNLVESSLTNAIEFSAYYQLPTMETAGELLFVNGVPEPFAVAKELSSAADLLDAKFTGRGLLNAVEYWKAIQDLVPRTPTAIAEAMLVAFAPVPKEEIEKYLKANEHWHQRSEDFLELWCGRYSRLPRKTDRRTLAV